MRLQAIPERAHADDGVSLVEIVVAMTVLALIAVAFLPMLVTGLKLSATNSSVTTATQLVSEQMNLARSQPSTCAALTTFTNSATVTTTDGNGKVLTTSRSLGTCPTGSGTVSFTASVTASGSSTVLATATTLIYVAS